MDFTKLPIETKVWNFTAGWGTIIDTDYKGGTIKPYPIRVQYDNGECETFTANGYAFEDDISPTLFLNEIKLFSDMPTLKEGMLVEIYGRKPIYRVISYGNKLCIVTGNVISSVYSEKIIAIWEDNGNENIHEIITEDDDIIWEVTHGKNA